MSESVLPAVPPDDRGHVLIVDDDPGDLQYIVRILREQGYVPHAATDANVALEFLRRELADLVLLDMHLPGMDGYEVCRRLKADERTRDVPVIFVSAENRTLDRVRAFAEGAVDYITKPFQPDEALARIRTHLSLRRLAARLAEEKERAEQASVAKSEFLASMSHELRTPLNAILGYAQILKMTGNLDPRQQRGVQAIHEAGDHLMRLISDLLDLARIEAGKMELAPSATSLSTVVRFVSHVIGVRAELKGLLFECRIEDELPPAVLVDEKRLSQVLLNLLGNAVKFTREGKVTLHVQALPDSGGAARLRFAVEDTGSGIAAKDFPAIFRPFEQVGEAKSRAGGAGLGLAISRRIVQLMGSDIQLRSELGAGSRFWFDLRLQQVDAKAAPLKERFENIRGYDGPRKTVLVADDIAANRDITCRMLSLAGLRTVEACDGREALERLRNDEPDLVIMDMLMPQMDGFEATRRIRQTTRFAAVPIIAVSASSYPSDRDRALEAGADSFLPKPLDFDKLFEHVGERLHLHWTTG